MAERAQRLRGTRGTYFREYSQADQPEPVVAQPITRDDVPQDSVANPAYQKAPASTVAARAVWLIAGTIMGLLALRFLLSLAGASRVGFADFIYTVSYPFAAPFFGIFGYDAVYGRARFEFETLFAIAVYGLAAMLIARLVTIRNRER